jgi:hypothetical protein
MCSAPQLLLLLMKLLVRQGWDVICFSPGAVAAADGGETCLGYDLLLTWCCCCC